MIIILIFPNTLFEDISKLISDNLISNYKIYILEHPLFFTSYNYHKMKLVLHRATMQYYTDFLREKYNNIKYIKYSGYNEAIKKILKNKNIIAFDPNDHILTNEFKNKVTFLESPGFLMSYENLKIYYNQHKTKNQRHAHFYKYHKDLLFQKYPVLSKVMIKNYDVENRKKFPKDYNEKIEPQQSNEYITKAINYVNKHFPNNPGSPNLFYNNIDFKGVKNMFKMFIKNKLYNFGDYEDAVRSDVIFGNHSIMSPFMNIGIITPEYALKQVIKKIDKISNNNIEGYLRQIIGWREYCRYIYLFFRTKLKGNPFKNNKKLNYKLWYNFDNKSIETVNVDYIKDMIIKVRDYAYLHHIERLMYVGNFMLIFGIHPNEVFKWFQCMFLDSYHIFMYPNVYGMSQHTSDIMMSKVYVCSSNYIHNMSDYSRNDYIDKLYKKFIKNI